ncbi:hypothetical protein GKZ89_18340 [Bacillus mangrovi]|uniref:Uncharacterized protein n=1 Tax=Metabacillus mangrovi TaxID=1491830 RepID=A0A7X2S8J6_9BACI|nr:hypothetical protein [Metabacillus mangrovi]MTH55357.1 hypothetical protein [Metabacillus mangrovi]
MTLAELKKNKPTEEWKERMDEDDDLFTEENIVASEKALDQYLQELEKLKIGNEAEITASVKKVVLKFNELNEEYDYFIETMEREELCEFILEAAQMCGLKIEDDITEEWREW